LPGVEIAKTVRKCEAAGGIEKRRYPSRRSERDFPGVTPNNRREETILRVADQLAEASHPPARPRRNDRKTVLSTSVLEVKFTCFFTQILIRWIDEEKDKLLQRRPKTVRNTFYA